MSRKSDAPAAQAEPSAPEESAPEPAGRIHTLDFSQPTKFTTEIRRRIGSAINQFCEALAGRLASELQTDVQLDVTEVDQRTWAAAKAQLPADSVAVAVQETSIERQMLLSVEPLLLLQALECLLGGKAAQAPASRRMSEIDWALAKGLLDGILAELSTAWRVSADRSSRAGRSTWRATPECLRRSANRLSRSRSRARSTAARRRCRC